jgi:hypothetical protein
VRLAALVELEEEEYRPTVEHVLTYQSQGVWDEDWIPRMASENWILITADKAKTRKGKGEPLSAICVRCGVTHVVLSKAIGRRKSFERMLTVLSLWYEIVHLEYEPRGSRFMIEPSGSGLEHRGRGRLVKKPLPSLRPPTPKGQLPFPGDP